MSCIFCNIIDGTIPASIIYQNQDYLVIKDIAPKAPIHYLIIPKKHIADVHALQTEDAAIMGNMLFVAQTLAQTLPEPQAFKLVMNNGAAVGQSVFHMHCHFLSGKRAVDV